MKKYIIIFVVIILIVVSFICYKFYLNSRYCSQFSGIQYYSGGYSGNSYESCLDAGCNPKKTKEVIDDPDAYDDEGYYFKCISK